jgi:uncharacterized protein (TIGR03085 family)
MSTSSRERAELADLLDELGPAAPTCCAGWTTAHLAAHLVVRDRRPDALPGYGLEQLNPSLGAWAHRLEDRLRTSTGYCEVVSRVRSGPPRWLPIGWPKVGDVLNTTEYVIHHEDVRRGQPGWAPRALPPGVQDELWRALAFFGRRAAGDVPGGLVLRRSDATGTERTAGGGDPLTTVTGEPLELLLWCSGRKDVARVEVS